MSTEAKWLAGWTMLGFAGAGATIYAALHHEWFSFVLAVLVALLSVCLQSECAERMKRCGN